MRAAVFLTVDDRFRTLGYAQAVHIVKTQAIDVHLFDEGTDLSPPQRAISGLTIHKNKLAPLVGTRLPSSYKWPPVVYGRLFVPQLLQEYDRLLYVDADIAMVGDIKPLLQIDLDGEALAAVHDADLWGDKSPIAGSENKEQWLRSIGIGKGRDRYFNSGVLLVDVARYAQFDVSSSLIAYFETHGAMVTMWDQDFLNYLFQSDWKELSPIWNFQAICTDSGFAEFIEPVIYHFNEVQKPWHDGYYFGDPRFTAYFQDIAAGAEVDITSFPRFVKSGAVRRTKYMVRNYLYRLGFRWKMPHRRVKEALDRRSGMIRHLESVLADGRYPVDTKALEQMKAASVCLGFNGNEVWNRVDGDDL